MIYEMMLYVIGTLIFLIILTIYWPEEAFAVGRTVKIRTINGAPAGDFSDLAGIEEVKLVHIPGTLQYVLSSCSRRWKFTAVDANAPARRFKYNESSPAAPVYMDADYAAGTLTIYYQVSDVFDSIAPTHPPFTIRFS